MILKREAHGAPSEEHHVGPLEGGARRVTDLWLSHIHPGDNGENTAPSGLTRRSPGDAGQRLPQPLRGSPKARAGSNLPMLICPHSRGISPGWAGRLGRRPHLESIQTQTCRRSEIRCRPGGRSALLRPGREWKPAKGHVDRAQPGWKDSQGVSGPGTRPAAPPPVILRVQPRQGQRDGRGRGAPGTTPSPSAHSPPLSPCPAPLRPTPWRPEGLAPPWYPPARGAGFPTGSLEETEIKSTGSGV